MVRRQSSDARALMLGKRRGTAGEGASKVLREQAIIGLGAPLRGCSECVLRPIGDAMKSVTDQPWMTCVRTALGVLVVCLVLPIGLQSSAADSSRYSLPDLEAVIIDKVLDFISWPPDAISQRQTFEVTVLGETPLFSRLERLLSGRALHGLPVSVRGAATPERVGRTHVLFMAPDQGPKLEAILARLASTPCLTIGDTQGFAERGVAVNLFQEEGRVRFAVRRSALSQARLRASYHLLSLARIVGETD